MLNDTLKEENLDHEVYKVFNKYFLDNQIVDIKICKLHSDILKKLNDIPNKLEELKALILSEKNHSEKFDDHVKLYYDTEQEYFKILGSQNKKDKIKEMSFL